MALHGKGRLGRSAAAQPGELQALRLLLLPLLLLLLLLLDETCCLIHKAADTHCSHY
jgi:hypothetical protein